MAKQIMEKHPLSHIEYGQSTLHHTRIKQAQRVEDKGLIQPVEHGLLVK